MQRLNFCQSCGMPLHDPSLHGKEMDDSINPDFCRHCYMNGAFVHPRLTLNKMTSRVVKKMEKTSIPADIIESVVKRLPDLKRWKQL